MTLGLYPVKKIIYFCLLMKPLEETSLLKTNMKPGEETSLLKTNLQIKFKSFWYYCWFNQVVFDDQC